MRWIAAVALIVIAAGCSDRDNSHREYIITQSQLESDSVKDFIELTEQ
jgi:uncharacterized lipoprotein